MKSFFRAAVNRVVPRFRAARARIFREHFELSPSTVIIDLGCEWGFYMAEVLSGTQVRPENVYVADIAEESIEHAEREYGFRPVVVPEDGRLPFRDKSFDIVFCNSVIEHVTLPKHQLLEVRSETIFRRRSLVRQREFAAEIKRLGKGHFVQTPNRWFPIEPHTKMPLMGQVPRQALLALMEAGRLNWTPDWNLLTVSEMRHFFPESDIITEKFLGIIKSIIAIKKWTPNA